MAKSYITSTFKVPQSCYEFVRNEAKGLNEHTFKLLCHIIASTVQQYREYRGWTPISSKLIQASLKKASITELSECGLVEVKDYERYSGKSREFKLKDKFLRGFIEANPLHNLDNSGALAYLKEPKVNLLNGELLKTSIKSTIYDENNNKEPELIVEAIRALKSCFYNQKNLICHLKQLREEVNDAPQGTELYSRRLLAFFFDLSCFEAVLNQCPLPTEAPDIYVFHPAYYVQSTGRIGVAGGGLQTCSRRMRKAAFTGVENLRVYDLEASQIFILKEKMREAKIQSEWLENYASDSLVRESFAKELGIDYAIWKRCLYALIMGATLPRKILKSDNVFKSYFLVEFSDAEILQEVFEKFRAMVEPLQGALREWQDYLLYEYVPTHATKAKGKTYLRNKTGKVCCIERLGSPRSKKSKLTAFLLQGEEAAFIHHLTLLGEKHGFQPISNEYDSLIVIGTIPAEAAEEARRLSGLTHFHLVKKSL